jgi:hypothetical protein
VHADPESEASDELRDAFNAATRTPSSSEISE